MCDVTGHSHWIDNVRCKIHQMRLQVKRTSRLRLKRETQGAFCVLNANAKSQTRKSMKINVICTVVALSYEAMVTGESIHIRFNLMYCFPIYCV